MKTLFTIACLFLSIFIFSQKQSIKKNDTINNVVTLNAIKFTVNSTQELLDIDWDDVKTLFKNNEAEEFIELAFEIDLPKSKNKFKSSFKVTGKTKEIDSLITRLKKGVKAISNISINYNKNK